jgi:hypothetical protein
VVHFYLVSTCHLAPSSRIPFTISLHDGEPYPEMYICAQRKIIFDWIFGLVGMFFDALSDRFILKSYFANTF